MNPQLNGWYRPNYSQVNIQNPTNLAEQMSVFLNKFNFFNQNGTTLSILSAVINKLAK